MRRASWKALLLAILAFAPAHAGAVEIDRRYERHVHRSAASPAGSALAPLTQLLGGCDRKAPFARSHALLIGVGRYRHLPALESPARDVARLRDYLLSQGGFDEVVVLQDEAATPEAISYFMEDYFPALFDDPGEAGRFLFYFSGHGTTRKLPGGDLRGYLRLANNREGIWSDAIGMNEIAEWAANVRAARHALFLIDTCVSGLAGFEPKGRYATDQSACDLVDLPGSLLLTAGQADERALGGRRWSGSLFTEAFLTGLLEGGADANGDDLITTLELFSYVRNVVSRESNGAQHPGLKDLAPPGRRGGELFFLRARPVRLPPPAAAGRVEVKAESSEVLLPPSTGSLAGISAQYDLLQVNTRLVDAGFWPEVYFRANEFALSDDARARLVRNAELLRQFPDLMLTIEGHTSAEGTNESNLALGERRAAAVRDFLVLLGIDSARLRTVNYGEEAPACTEETAGCRAQSARVHMLVSGRMRPAPGP